MSQSRGKDHAWEIDRKENLCLLMIFVEEDFIMWPAGHLCMHMTVGSLISFTEN
jgi:hypothetical protein